MGHKRRGALFVAVIFILQWAMGVWTASAMPVGPQVDIFGNPLCVTAPGTGSFNTGSDHATPTACCMAGRHLPSCALSSGVSEAYVVVRHRSVDTGSQEGQVKTILLARDHDPGRPRAPPTI